MTKVYASLDDLEPAEMRGLYDAFDAPIAALDCGQQCAPHNPGGKPFCCDICHAVPAAYQSEWTYLKDNTDLWHEWRGGECDTLKNAKAEKKRLQADTPPSMILLACLGPSRCQRSFRALSCRQFPFFPYVTSDYRFLGLAYEWEFESKCWVISNLGRVMKRYREEFVRTYDHLFALFQEEFENYTFHSEKMRAVFHERRRRIPLLHRNGGYYLISPVSERARRASIEQLPSFAPYK